MKISFYVLCKSHFYCSVGVLYVEGGEDGSDNQTRVKYPLRATLVSSPRPKGLPLHVVL